jgi:serine/threonine protein kinase
MTELYLSFYPRIKFKLGDLNNLLQNLANLKKPLKEIEVLNWTLQLARGLAKIHEKAIIHRNITPKYEIDHN